MEIDHYIYSPTPKGITFRFCSLATPNINIKFFLSNKQRYIYAPPHLVLRANFYGTSRQVLVSSTPFLILHNVNNIKFNFKVF